jgi:predicted nucleic acid-binding protein
MKIILDSNVLFSALIKDSTSRKFIVEYGSLFLFPEFIFEEMKKHKSELFNKSGMNKADFSKLLQLLLKKVIVVPNSTLLHHRKEALEIVKDIDPGDAIFVACALAYPDSIIWSEDKRLKMQTKIKVMNTLELKSFLQN